MGCALFGLVSGGLWGVALDASACLRAGVTEELLTRRGDWRVPVRWVSSRR